MSIIYEPIGKAKEYSELAVNLYTGCLHGCKYCYCPSILRKSLCEWSANPQPRKDILRLLEKDAEKHFKEERQVLFSFMADPYQSPEAAKLTRQALLICEKNKFKNVSILTKGGTMAIPDFDILQRNNWKFGQTIIFKDEQFRQVWEPGASSIMERYYAVQKANLEGIFTWISIEPVINTFQALTVIYDLINIIDFWKVGKLNHNKTIEDSINWTNFYKKAIKLLEGKDYMIKKDLLKYA
jgi:DNA repair photolyase